MTPHTQALIDRYYDELLEPAERPALEQALRTEPAAQAYFHRLARLEVHLSAHYAELRRQAAEQRTLAAEREWQTIRRVGARRPLWARLREHIWGPLGSVVFHGALVLLLLNWLVFAPPRRTDSPAVSWVASDALLLEELPALPEPPTPEPDWLARADRRMSVPPPSAEAPAMWLLATADPWQDPLPTDGSNDLTAPHSAAFTRHTRKLTAQRALAAARTALVNADWTPPRGQTIHAPPTRRAALVALALWAAPEKPALHALRASLPAASTGPPSVLAARGRRPTATAPAPVPPAWSAAYARAHLIWELETIWGLGPQLAWRRPTRFLGRLPGLALGRPYGWRGRALFILLTTPDN